MTKNKVAFTCIREGKRILTPDGTNEVVRLIERGYSVETVSDRLNVDKTSIINVMKKRKKDVPAVKGMHPALILGLSAFNS